MGRPKSVWKVIPVEGKQMSAPEAAKFLKMKLNTLHQQLIRDRANCQTDGHAFKEGGVWIIHESIKQVFKQKA